MTTTYKDMFDDFETYSLNDHTILVSRINGNQVIILTKIVEDDCTTSNI
jgi:hypothetical protein